MSKELPTGRDFYDGHGFDHLTGDGAQVAHDFDAKVAEMRAHEPLKGNLYDSRVNADFPGSPCLLPINFLLYPERGMDFVLLRGEPGSRFPEHVHGYGDEIYLIISGRGFVIIDGEEYPAEQHDIFYIPAGVPHWYRAADDSTEPFDLFAVNTPAVKADMRSTYWAGKPKVTHAHSHLTDGD